ncbi:MAG: hypothetical protein ACREFI_13765 [Stellaceae bacterium]
MRLGQVLVAIIALAIGYGTYRYAMTNAIHTVITSQPAPQKYVDPPTVDWTGCNFGLSTSRPSAASKPCRYEPNEWPTMDPPKAPPQISEAAAKEAALWFASAGFLPLLLGAVVAVVGFAILRAHAARAESRRAYAELERIAGLGPERDPFDRELN